MLSYGLDINNAEDVQEGNNIRDAMIDNDQKAWEAEHKGSK